MEEMLKGIMREISGVNEELLGSATDEKAGILSMLRQGAGLTSLQRLFDQCDETQRLCGNLIVEMIQKNWSYNKVKDVIGEEPTNEFDDKAFFDYGCKVIQGVLTETQQQLELGQLLNLAEIQAQNLAPPIMEKIIDTMYIQNKDELKEAMAKFTEAQNQQQQQMQQLQMQQMQVDNATKISYAKSQEGLAMERVSNIKTDNAVAMEKIRRSETEDTAQLVNVLKALKELRGLDIDHLSSQLELLHSINSIDFDATERQKLKDEMDRSAKAEVASQKQTAGV
jgi:hypothetical protein